MPADTDVANDALAQLGESPITGLDQGTPKANYCQQFFASIVDDAIRRYNWAFAREFQKLAEITSVSTDPFRIKWDHKFGLPADPYCLAVRCLNNSELAEWEVGSGRVLLCNDATAKIEYSARVSDPTLWDATFYQAVTLGLAGKLVAALKHDYTGSRQLMAMYQAIFTDATYHSSQESKLTGPENQDALILVRGD